MSDDDQNPKSNESRDADQPAAELAPEELLDAVSHALSGFSADATDLSAKMDSESMNVAQEAKELIGNIQDLINSPLKDGAAAESGDAVDPGKSASEEDSVKPLSEADSGKPALKRTPSIPLLDAIATAAENAASAAKRNMETVKDAAGRAATAMDNAQRDLAKKLNVEPMEFAPLNVPMERRRQTFSVLLWALVAPISWGLCLYFIFFTSSTFLRLLFFLYCGWIYLDDAQTKGSRPIPFIRNLPLWKWFADYYPVTLIKTADLDPKKSYLFGYHPHGVLGFGAWSLFATNGSNFEETFPGIQPHLCTININFKTPFGREYLMAHGVISADKKSILNVWKKGNGESVALVIGGAEEGYYAKPGTADLVLNKRLGFVKLALSEGVSIVPCFAFGENELFEVITNPTLDRISKFVKDNFGFTTPLIHGRGIFSYNYGILPRRRPITVVVGVPIQLPKVADPGEDVIKEYHAKYQEGLKAIYDEWKVGQGRRNEVCGTSSNKIFRVQERLSPKRRQSLRFIK